MSTRSTGIESTDRYGGNYPDTETMCKGLCEGMGCYPVERGHYIGAQDRALWEAAHGKPGAHEDGPCDGWHFVTCPDCDGTGESRR